MTQHYRYNNTHYLRNSIHTDMEVLKACMYDLVELTSGQLYVLLNAHLVIIFVNNQPDAQLCIRLVIYNDHKCTIVHLQQIQTL